MGDFFVADFGHGVGVAAEETLQIVDGGLGDVAQSLLGQEGLMAGDQHIGHGNQTNQLVVTDDVAGEVLVEEVAFLLINVQTGGADLLGLQALDQVVGVNQTASGGVDDGDGGLHQLNGCGVDQMMGFLSQRAVEGDDVGLGEQLVELHIIQAGVGVGELVVGQDLHAKATADVTENAANLTGANQAHGLAVQIEAGKAVEGEVEVAGAQICLVSAAVDGQQQSHGVLSDRIRGVGGDTEHAQLAGSGLDVHVVEAGAAQGNGLDAQLVEAVHNFLIDGVVNKNTDGVIAGGQGNGVGVELGLEKFQFQIGTCGELLETGDIIGFGIKKCDFHNA